MSIGLQLSCRTREADVEADMFASCLPCASTLQRMVTTLHGTLRTLAVSSAAVQVCHWSRPPRSCLKAASLPRTPDSGRTARSRCVGLLLVTLTRSDSFAASPQDRRICTQPGSEDRHPACSRGSQGLHRRTMAILRCSRDQGAGRLAGRGLRPERNPLERQARQGQGNDKGRH